MIQLLATSINEGEGVPNPANRLIFGPNPFNRIILPQILVPAPTEVVVVNSLGRGSQILYKNYREVADFARHTLFFVRDFVKKLGGSQILYNNSSGAADFVRTKT